jgi:hypothetical protein
MTWWWLESDVTSAAKVGEDWTDVVMHGRDSLLAGAAVDQIIAAAEEVLAPNGDHLSRQIQSIGIYGRELRERDYATATLPNTSARAAYLAAKRHQRNLIEERSFGSTRLCINGHDIINPYISPRGDIVCRRCISENAAFEATKRPIQRKAREALHYAIRRGRIIKPQSCEQCGATVRSRLLHGHHADYAKPLEVKWLCFTCHVAIHPRSAAWWLGDRPAESRDHRRNHVTEKGEAA